MKPFVRLIPSVYYRVNPVLPQAYDDSLSYFEVLAKLQKKINEIIETVNSMMDAIEDLDKRLGIVEEKVANIEETIAQILEDISDIKTDISNIIDGTTVIDISNNPSITNLGDRIDDIVDGTTEINITNNKAITDILDGTTPVPTPPYNLPTMSANVKGGAKLGSGLIIDNDTLSVDGENIDITENVAITNILDGTTPVPTPPYDLPTMSANVKGGAKLGSGLLINNDTLSVDGENIDISDNQTITDIIDGTTPIDISNNQTITDIIDGTTQIDISNNETITDIVDGTTEIDLSNNTTITNIIDGTTPIPVAVKQVSVPVTLSNSISNLNAFMNLQRVGNTVYALLNITDTIPFPVATNDMFSCTITNNSDLNDLFDGLTSCVGEYITQSYSGYVGGGQNLSKSYVCGQISIIWSNTQYVSKQLSIRVDMRAANASDLDPQGVTATAQAFYQGAFSKPFALLSWA